MHNMSKVQLYLF